MLGEDILQKIFRNIKNSCFNPIAGINSGPATLLNRSLHQGGFPVNKFELLALLKIPIDKIAGYKAETL